MISATETRKVELNGKRFRKESRIAVRDAGAASRANLDIHNPLRFESAQSIARDDAADIETLGQILLGAEKIAGPGALAKRASRTSLTIRVDKVPPRKGRTFRSASLIAGCKRMT